MVFSTLQCCTAVTTSIFPKRASVPTKKPLVPYAVPAPASGSHHLAPCFCGPASSGFFTHRVTPCAAVFWRSPRSRTVLRSVREAAPIFQSFLRPKKSSTSCVRAVFRCHFLADIWAVTTFCVLAVVSICSWILLRGPSRANPRVNTCFGSSGCTGWDCRLVLWLGVQLSAGLPNWPTQWPPRFIFSPVASSSADSSTVVTRGFAVVAH